MPAYSTEIERYNAVLTRDQKADTVFFYAVLTTGVYCYPSCPSKASLKENTRYFSTRQEAIDNGFRACKRCQSDDKPLLERQRDLVESACRLIDEAQGSRKIEEVAKAIDVSRYHLQKLFKQFLGVSPKAYSNSARTQSIERTLSNGKSVTHAVLDAGYNQSSSFYATGANRLGMNPKDYQHGGRGLMIRYAFAKTSFGKIIVATTEKGVCCILFGQSQHEMVEDLQTRFSQASLERDSTSLESLLLLVVRKIEKPHNSPAFPLDIQGTAFQEKVWRALQDIWSDIRLSLGSGTKARNLSPRTRR